uniref:Constitutive coactivator of peroxisome proliferator-activated receptor gamma n=1 Tax=Cacopsylla melanoneura TaxID=428564 RepID=A0A8D9A8W0_9HEMI
MQNFYKQFRDIGVQLIAFLGNYKPKTKRQGWIKRRYDHIDRVNRIMTYAKANMKPVANSDFGVFPSELVDTVAAVIRFVLKETIVHSLTETDMEIIAYARKHKSFGILSQDTDFSIANAAHYYLSMRHLCLQNMTTCVYDSRGLADHLQLQVNQLPLFATLMGNDVMEEDMFKPMDNMDFDDARYEIKLSKIVNTIASLCRPIECNDIGFPKCENDLENLGNLTCKNSDTTIFVNLMKDSIASYSSYHVEEELLVDRMNISSDQKDIINLAMTLYRQCWITSGVFMVLCGKEVKMGACIEIYNDVNIRPIGDVLGHLRRVLYGALFQGDQTVRISEYIITGERCLDNGPTTVTPAQLKSVRSLNDVWRRSLKPGHRQMDKVWELLTESVLVDDHVWVRAPEHIEDMRKYFVSIFAQSCDMKPNVVEKLLEILPGLPSEVHVPLFTFLYLDYEPGAFLSSSERDAVLFTFSLVSVLSSTQLHTFLQSPQQFMSKAESNHLIRAANLFMKTTQLIINLNAVCGFPIPLEAVNGHNYWQGSVVQLFYQFLYGHQKRPLDLYYTLCSILKVNGPSTVYNINRNSDKKSSPLYKFVRVMHGWTELGLLNDDLAKVVRESS